MKRIVLSMSAALLVTVTAGASASTVLNLSDFSDCTALQVNTSAVCTGNMLQLTQSSAGLAGSAFTKTEVALGTNDSFSTFFTFQILNAGGLSDSDGPGSDGLTFTMQSGSNTALGGAGSALGFGSIAQSVAVEFDTFDNGAGAGDPNGNHVGIDENGSLYSLATASVPTRLNNGSIWYAWVDYDGSTLQVRLSQSAVRPGAATLSYPIDLASILGSQAYVGFTAGTGGGWEEHDILSWQLNNSYSPIGPTLIEVPTLSNFGLLLELLLLIALAYPMLRRRRASSKA